MSDLKITVRDCVMTIVMNRPHRKNALTQDMYEGMTEAMHQASQDANIRVVLFTGVKDCYCGGNDLSEFPDDPDQGGPTFVWDFIKTLIEAEFPVIAVVNGVSAGIGSTMLLHMDNVIASAETPIHYSFINMALVPEAGSSLLLPRIMGHAKAADILMRGRRLSGQEAFDLGIVSTLTNPEKVLSTGLSIAKELAQKPPNALRRTKVLLKRDTKEVLRQIKIEEKELFAQLGSEEFKSAVKAFLNKSKK